MSEIVPLFIYLNNYSLMAAGSYTEFRVSVDMALLQNHRLIES